jgi:hypothetical protein
MPRPPREFGPIAASLLAAGQELRARAFDAMIAAIAVSQDLPIYTLQTPETSPQPGQSWSTSVKKAGRHPADPVIQDATPAGCDKHPSRSAVHSLRLQRPRHTAYSHHLRSAGHAQCCRDRRPFGGDIAPLMGVLSSCDWLGTPKTGRPSMPKYSDDPVVSVTSTPDHAAVFAESAKNEGVRAVSHSEHGAVVGINDLAPASPLAAGGVGGWFESARGEGVRGTSKNAQHAGVVGINTSSGQAGYFVGDVEITGDLILSGADCAEALEVAEAVHLEAGMVAVVGSEGRLEPCDRANDPRVAGIVSGAGGLKPALVLDRRPGAVPIALIGTAWCWCDADFGAISPGDRLTTSPRVGHAQRSDDGGRSPASIIGKALTGLDDGVGLVRVLIAAR